MFPTLNFAGNQNAQGHVSLLGKPGQPKQVKAEMLLEVTPATATRIASLLDEGDTRLLANGNRVTIRAVGDEFRYNSQPGLDRTLETQAELNQIIGLLLQSAVSTASKGKRQDESVVSKRRGACIQIPLGPVGALLESLVKLAERKGLDPSAAQAFAERLCQPQAK